MDVNVLNLFNLFLLTEFVYKDRVASVYNDKQRKIEINLRLKNNSGEILEPVMSPMFTISEEKMLNNEFSNPNQLNFKFREKLLTYDIETRKHNIFQRKIRNLENKSTVLDCVSCFGNGSSKTDNDCYLGLSSVIETCGNSQECYTEVHPNYIKRGCISKNKLHRIFVCNCPLCNDKPSDDISYYEYETIRDWEYDNKRLQNSLIGMDLVCKLCETKGTDIASDKICRLGRDANYMVCGQNQICYVKIDANAAFVSRGCIDKPSYNTFYKFCNTTLCNLNLYKNPKIPPIEELTINAPKSIILVSKAYKKYRNFEVYLLLCSLLTSI